MNPPYQIEVLPKSGIERSNYGKCYDDQSQLLYFIGGKAIEDNGETKYAI